MRTLAQLGRERENSTVPELPDLTVYLEALDLRITGRVLERVRLRSPFLLRSVRPPLSIAEGRTVVGLRRLGKRLVFDLGDEVYLVLHLMVSGRLKWRKPGVALGGKIDLAAFDFAEGSLVLTEAASKKRASLRVVEGAEGLRDQDPGGLEPLEISLDTFRAALSRENRTLKRALTDPRILAGIGNAYSDEVLHAARLSPFRRTSGLADAEWRTLYDTMRSSLVEWTERLRRETGDRFPEKVTAFRPEMAVHGKYRQPCPVCGTAIQRVLYAENECDYCPTCQTAGKLLADRALSQLMKEDWPRTLEELEEKKAAERAQGFGPALPTN
jgi:formamidopyrimidine-DNA glycosylase